MAGVQDLDQEARPVEQRIGAERVGLERRQGVALCAFDHGRDLDAAAAESGARGGERQRGADARLGGRDAERVEATEGMTAHADAPGVELAVKG